MKTEGEGVGYSHVESGSRKERSRRTTVDKQSSEEEEETGTGETAG